MAHTKYHTNWVAEKIIVEIDRNQSFKNGLEVKKKLPFRIQFWAVISIDFPKAYKLIS